MENSIGIVIAVAIVGFIVWNFFFKSDSSASAPAPVKAKAPAKAPAVVVEVKRLQQKLNLLLKLRKRLMTLLEMKGVSYLMPERQKIK